MNVSTAPDGGKYAADKPESCAYCFFWGGERKPAVSWRSVFILCRRRRILSRRKTLPGKTDAVAVRMGEPSLVLGTACERLCRN